MCLPKTEVHLGETRTQKVYLKKKNVVTWKKDIWLFKVLKLKNDMELYLNYRDFRSDKAVHFVLLPNPLTVQYLLYLTD